MPLRSSSGSARPASRRGTRSTPVDGREVYRRRAPLFQEAPIDVGDVWDTTIPSPAGPLGIRVYRPDGGPPRPIFVYLHGGGWTLGDLDTHDTVCRRISRRGRLHGRRASTTGWRRSIPYPAAMDDTIAAVRWLAAHGAELGGDPTRLALGGDSAGGNLTAGRGASGCATRAVRGSRSRS